MLGSISFLQYNIKKYLKFIVVILNMSKPSKNLFGMSRCKYCGEEVISLSYFEHKELFCKKYQYSLNNIIASHATHLRSDISQPSLHLDASTLDALHKTIEKIANGQTKEKLKPSFSSLGELRSRPMAWETAHMESFNDPLARFLKEKYHRL